MPRFTQTMYAHVPAARAAAAFVDRHILAFNLGAIALLVAMLGLYIGQVNAAVSRSYAMRDLERRTQELSEQNRRLELAVSRIQTLDHVERSMKILGLVPAGRPTYVAGAVPAVAFAK